MVVYLAGAFLGFPEVAHFHSFTDFVLNPVVFRKTARYLTAYRELRVRHLIFQTEVIEEMKTLRCC